MRTAFQLLTVIAALTIGSAAHAQEDGAKYGDWTVKCEGEGAGRLCHIGQDIVRSNTSTGAKMTALQVGIAYSKKNAPPQILIMAPIGVLLFPGIEIQIDGGEKANVPFVQCLPVGCRTLLDMEEDTVSRIKAGTTMNVTYASPNGEKIAIPVSLKGVTAGLEAIKPK